MSILQGQGLHGEQRRRFNPLPELRVQDRVAVKRPGFNPVFGEIVARRGFRYRIRLDNGIVFSAHRMDLRKAK